MMRTRQFNDEVLFSDVPTAKFDSQDMDFLKAKAATNPRKRIRVCAHLDVEDTLHEMFIVHAKDTYVRPHKHLNKSESIHVIEGSLDMIIFDETGSVAEIVQLGDYSSGKQFYYRSSESLFHTLLISSEILVFHETTNGPFDRSDTVWAPWAPEYGDPESEKQWMEQLNQIAAKYYDQL